jgi:OOP family OmpA-OmpF porin
MKLTPLSKILLSSSIIGAVSLGVYTHRDELIPAKRAQQSLVPTLANIASDTDAGCANEPEIRFYLWAWNAQMGLMHATGGPQATEESLMCQRKVNLKLIREDNVDQMQSLLLTFAEHIKKGEDNPAEGAHFVAIMGDGSAAFLKGLNDRLRALGDEYMAVVVGSAGYSRGEDKFMGPAAWKKNPQLARGGVVAGVLRDGDWNIAMKWLSDNGIPNNPDETVYDPNALNWVAASDYVDAAQKYVSGYCAELKHSKTGETVHHCVDAVVTWTPGDVTVAKEKGGLVSIVSTKEYRSQMPNVIIGNKKWMQEHPELVKNMLSAIFDGGDAVKKSDEALRHAASVSAAVYNEQDASYWYKYFSPTQEADRQGLMVSLGGSSVNNLADNAQLFGLTKGSTNLFAATYTVFGQIVSQQYPALMPSFYPAGQITDTTYVKALFDAQSESAVGADMPSFQVKDRVAEVVSRKGWDIQFKSGSAQFTPKAEETMQSLLQDLVIANGTLVEIHGHTDNVGNVEKNMALSEARAFAVKEWLETQAPANFPKGRVKVFAHGSLEPVAANTSEAGRAQNRRVEIVMGSIK